MLRCRVSRMLRVLAVSVWSPVFLLLPLASAAWGQSQAAVSASSVVPGLVRFGGTLRDAQGKPLNGTVGVTFALYKDQQGGSPLWQETQNVTLNSNGGYSVQLGSTVPGGLPLEVFASGEARWLGVQADGQAEQPRVLLLSVPYALKAADAETVGGMPPSAFVLATPASSSAGASAASATASAVAPSTPPPTVGGSGTANFIPLWTDSVDLGNSVLFQLGTGATAKIGMGTTTPSTTLDVKGTGTIRGALSLPSISVATAAKGSNSQPVKFVASAFSSGTNAAVNETFQWQAEPTGNDTTAPSGTMNLLFGSGSAAPVETGLKVSSKGLFTFATGQTFPGAGTINGVTAGTGLTGGGTTGTVTLNLDTSKIPELNTANTFTGNQTVSGNVSATGIVSGSSFEIGSTLFAFGSISSGNVFLGFSGNLATTGTQNTANGAGALGLNTTGSFNTATGSNALPDNSSGNNNTANGGAALESNTTGSNNTAAGAFALVSNTTASNNTANGASALGGNTTGGSNTAAGYFSLVNNTTGSNNTAVGYNAGPDSGHPNLTNATAIGANAVVGASNAMVLGGTGGNAVNVGIGTATPAFALDVHGTGNFTGPITFAAGQIFPGTGTITGVTAGTDLVGGGSTGSVTLNVDTTKIVTGVTAGTGLTGGGTGGVQTLSIDTTKVPQLSAPNTFTTDQTVNGNLSATGTVAGSSLTIGGSLFAFGTYLKENAFVGFAGNITTTGTNNTGIGISSLLSNGAGNNNTATGAFALAINSSGGSNTATGQQALYSNSGGSFNTANGATALFATTTGNNNTATGYQALFYNTTGFANTASGEQALLNTTTGDSNTASGQQALFSNTTGEGNTGNGTMAVYSNGTGLANTGEGLQALYYATGSFNSGLGYTAGPDKNTSSISNSTAIGAFADVTESNAMVLGSIAGVNNASSDTLVGIGITAPTYLLHLGNRGLTNNALRVEGPAHSGSGGMAASFGGFGDFGLDAPGIVNGRFVVKENGRVGIGTAAPDNTLSVNGSADKTGGGSWGTFSDGRLKTVGGSFNAGLSEILKLHPIHYRYKEENALGIRDHDDHVGFVAQEVQKVIPEAVSENSRGYLLVNNDPILWAMLNAIQEQQRQIRQQQQQIMRLSGRVGALQAALRTTKSQVKSAASKRVQVVKGVTLSAHQ